MQFSPCRGLQLGLKVAEHFPADAKEVEKLVSQFILL
jgi:hypothetical protein